MVMLATARAYFGKYGGFPLRIYRVESQGKHAPHGHEFEELVIALAGSGIHHTETDEYEISAGDVFVIRRGCKHAYSFAPELSLINVLFDPDRLHVHWQGLRDLPGYHSLFQIEPRMRRDDRFTSRLRLSEDQLARTAELVMRIEDEMHRARGGYRFMAAAYFMELVGYLSRCYTEMELPETRPVIRIGNVLSFIETNYDQHITIACLAHVANMSEATLMRAFKKSLGRSPMDHVIRTRIDRAKEMLAHSDFTVTEICFACGFNDSNYFSRQFRKITGQSPSTFRKKLGEEAGGQ